MELTGENSVWIGINGVEVFAASNLKGLSEDIGASYSTVKEKGNTSDKFSVAVGKMEDLRVWYVVRVAIRRVGGRGGLRVKKGE